MVGLVVEYCASPVFKMMLCKIFLVETMVASSEMVKLGRFTLLSKKSSVFKDNNGVLETTGVFSKPESKKDKVSLDDELSKTKLSPLKSEMGMSVCVFGNGRVWVIQDVCGILLKIFS